MVYFYTNYLSTEKNKHQNVVFLLLYICFAMLINIIMSLQLTVFHTDSEYKSELDNAILDALMKGK